MVNEAFFKEIKVHKVPNEAEPGQTCEVLTVDFETKDETKDRQHFRWLVQWDNVVDLFKEAYRVEVTNQGEEEGLFRQAAFYVIVQEIHRLNEKTESLDDVRLRLRYKANFNLYKAIKFDRKRLFE